MSKSTFQIAAGINPTKLAGLARVFVRHGRDFFNSQTSLVSVAGDQGPEKSDAPSSIAGDLEKLGPTFVKFGQLLSTRPDLIPENWLASLETLQDSTETVPFEELREVFEKDLGVKLSRAFASIDEKPLAAASLAQVHAATLRESERRVVVKIMKPSVEDDVKDDLDTLGSLFDILVKNADEDDTRAFQLEQFVRDFRETLIDELNYPLERRNLRRLGKNLATFEHIVVPKPVDDFCGDRVLTMERIEGQNITHLSPLVLTGGDHEHLAEEIFLAYLKQILDDGFFHADPHPGNILLTTEGKAAFLDLGMVGRLSSQQQDLVLELLVAVAQHDDVAVAQCAERIGEPRPGFDRATLQNGMTRVVSAHQGRGVGEMEVGSLVLEVTQVATDAGVIIPRAVSLLGKTMLNLDRIGMALDPGFDPAEVIRRTAPKYVTQRIRRKLSSANLLGFANEVEEFASMLPHRLNTIVSKLGDGKLKLEVEAIDEDALIKGIQKVANRITVGLILAALIVGAAMIMNVETEQTLWGYPTLAIVFFLAAAVGGCVLVGNILFKDR